MTGTPSIRPIRFVHRGRIEEVSDAPITRTVLDWLREDARCTGTKEGCGEGDCGACTVIVAELDDDRLQLRPVNSCIRFLPTLDGKALLTVEDLGSPQAPHPVQQAMVECHGSQCGFCTPGFVMSMAATYERHCAAGTRPTRQQLADDLAGNLCRCTGYRPILDAGQRMFELPTRRIDTAALTALLQALRADPPLHHAAPHPAFAAEDTARGPDHAAPAKAPRIDHFHAPRDLASLAALREAHPDARLLAGSTDIGLWVTKQFRDVGNLIYLGQVEELRRIESIEANGRRWLRIGAAVPLEDAWSAIAALWTTLQEVALRFAGPPVRHAGTLVGNLANGSPIGDSAPVLMALDARLVLRRGARQRHVTLDDFYLDYMKNRLEPGEFVEAVEIPEAAPGSLPQVRAWKISKRFDCDISALCAGLSLTLEGGRVADVRIAFGGMAAMVKRATRAEAALCGQPWTEATLQAAQAALDVDFTPLSDLRASADYRRRTARAMLTRLWLETRPDAPCAEPAVRIWARPQEPSAQKGAGA
jgi:xanthine dehydrogenase small subunit